ncbi:unnamed protein product [Psylliodes chrysocephalus]|uniref:TTF-type domain-containing protein n=1 Tax=Psylliodes chrysocephalus TaxID=3402493 RepID=A0A9P0DDX9_9CUCU|nr:unnamed protein product [Psylliodes chrysocephala]
MVYSPSKGSVSCIPCMIFDESDNRGAFSNGFNDWKNVNQRVKDHENSFNHKNSSEKLKIRSFLKGRVDVRLIEALELGVHYWREELYNFFSASPHRWIILTRNCALTMQNLSKTLWFARHNACRAVNESREEILKSLDEIASDCDERHSTRNEDRTINEK